MGLTWLETRNVFEDDLYHRFLVIDNVVCMPIFLGFEVDNANTATYVIYQLCTRRSICSNGNDVSKGTNRLSCIDSRLSRCFTCTHIHTYTAEKLKHTDPFLLHDLFTPEGGLMGDVELMGYVELLRTWQDIGYICFLDIADGLAGVVQKLWDHIQFFDPILLV